MQLIREYALHNLNWALLPDVINRIVQAIPQEELRRGDLEFFPQTLHSVGTFSQWFEVESPTEFLDFIEKSNEGPKTVEIEVCCMGHIDKDVPALKYGMPFFRLTWGKRNRIRIEILRTTAALALSHLQTVEKILQLEPRAPAQEESERKPLKRHLFIAHSFDDRGRSYAYQLTKFLNLLGFEVATGEGYSPEKISTKVRRRLMAQEVVIAVLSPQEDHTWLVQEMAGADLLGKPLIPLMEKGVEMKAGMHGDLEYVQFEPYEISQAFAPIVEGLRELGFTFGA